jgi:hypothetical protein
MKKKILRVLVPVMGATGLLAMSVVPASAEEAPPSSCVGMLISGSAVAPHSVADVIVSVKGEAAAAGYSNLGALARQVAQMHEQTFAACLTAYQAIISPNP